MTNEIRETRAQLATDALKRLLRIARSDTGQSKRVADFLLAWWNAQNCGGWDPTDLWSVDHEIAEDMLMVLRMIAAARQYPDSLGLGPQFEELIRNWRPRLLSEQAV
jgi:hypothetical protein